MENDKVIFKIAKLDKENGFNTPVSSHYSTDMDLFDNDTLIWTSNLEKYLN